MIRRRIVMRLIIEQSMRNGEWRRTNGFRAKRAYRVAAISMNKAALLVAVWRVLTL